MDLLNFCWRLILLKYRNGHILAYGKVLHTCLVRWTAEQTGGPQVDPLRNDSQMFFLLSGTNFIIFKTVYRKLDHFCF
jgi:hypothetical protein